MTQSKGENSTYRPDVGTVCLVSGPNCDDTNGYLFEEMTILWRSDLFVLYGTEGFWPNLVKWDHVLCKKIPEKQTVWVNVTRNDSHGHWLGAAFPSRHDADREAFTSRIACVQITFTEGEGLDGGAS